MKVGHIMLKKDFINKYWPDAKAACAGSAIFPLLALAESAVESAWGESYLTKEANNFFGEKSTQSWEQSGGKYVVKPTHEVIDGKSVVVNAKFRKYDNAQKSYENYVHFVTQPGYVSAGVTKATSPEDQIRCIAHEGYATDPHYADTIISVMHGLLPLITG